MSGKAFFAYEDLSVGSTATGLTAATYGTGDYAMILVEGGPVRFRMDAGTPTASVGDTLEVGDRLELFGTDEVTRVKFIRRDTTSATLRCNYAKVI